MLQPPAHRLEVHTTELAHDVRRVALRSPVGSAFDPGSHTLDFVLDQGFPVFAVDVTFLAVEVSGIVTLVSLHVLFVVEGLEATLDVARHTLDGLERHRHLAGLDAGKVAVDDMDVGRSVFVWSFPVFSGYACPWCWRSGWQKWLSKKRKKSVAGGGDCNFQCLMCRHENNRILVVIVACTCYCGEVRHNWWMTDCIVDVSE